MRELSEELGVDEVPAVILPRVLQGPLAAEAFEAHSVSLLEDFMRHRLQSLVELKAAPGGLGPATLGVQALIQRSEHACEAPCEQIQGIWQGQQLDAFPRQGTQHRRHSLCALAVTTCSDVICHQNVHDVTAYIFVIPVEGGAQSQARRELERGLLRIAQLLAA
jgi:hypothetical protein